MILIHYASNLNKSGAQCFSDDMNNWIRQYLRHDCQDWNWVCFYWFWMICHVSTFNQIKIKDIWTKWPQKHFFWWDEGLMQKIFEILDNNKHVVFEFDLIEYWHMTNLMFISFKTSLNTLDFNLDSQVTNIVWFNSSYHQKNLAHQIYWNVCV